MTETEYREKQTQDTNQLKKAFDAGYSKGRKGGIDVMRDAARRVVGSNLMLFADINAEAKRLKEQGNGNDSNRD